MSKLDDIREVPPQLEYIIQFSREIRESIEDLREELFELGIDVSARKNNINQILKFIERLSSGSANSAEKVIAFIRGGDYYKRGSREDIKDYISPRTLKGLNRAEKSLIERYLEKVSMPMYGVSFLDEMLDQFIMLSEARVPSEDLSDEWYDIWLVHRDNGVRLEKVVDVLEDLLEDLRHYNP